MKEKPNEKVLEVDNGLIDVNGLAWGEPKKDKRKKQKDKKGEDITLDVNDSFCG